MRSCIDGGGDGGDVELEVEKSRGLLLAGWFRGFKQKVKGEMRQRRIH